jgi:hypothetical protein
MVVCPQDSAFYLRLRIDRHFSVPASGSTNLPIDSWLVMTLVAEGWVECAQKTRLAANGGDRLEEQIRGRDNGPLRIAAFRVPALKRDSCCVPPNARETNNALIGALWKLPLR